MKSNSNFGPQLIGLWCAVAASLSGVAYFALAQAPLAFAGINLAALVLGILVLASMRRVPGQRALAPYLMLLMAVLILATALFGVATEGASRWVMIGPIFTQPSLILLPTLIVLFVRYRTGLTTLAMIIAALSLALQPDRGMAGVLLVAMLALSVVRYDRFVLAALLASLSAFAVTLALPDTLPAVPFVDQVYYTAFDVHWFAGVLVITGTALLLLPALSFTGLGDLNKDTCIVFGATWLAVILAAALGNYPTPVVGYSGAAILGYVVSLGVLPRKASSEQVNTLGNDQGANRSEDGEDVHERVPAFA